MTATESVTPPAADLDFYIEPEWATDLLLTLPFFSAIQSALDPCCGSGNIVRALWRQGIVTRASDIVDRGVEGQGRFDFFALDRLPRGIDAIVSNPPYGSARTAQRFAEHALSLKPKLLAIFVENRFLASQTRHAFFTTFRPTQIAFLSDRPSCPPGDAFLRGEIKATGGKQDYCWLIWCSWLAGMPQAPVWLRRAAA